MRFRRSGNFRKGRGRMRGRFGRGRKTFKRRGAAGMRMSGLKIGYRM